MRAFVLALGTPAAAHLMPAHHGTLNVRESSVFGVLAVPVSAVAFVDDDHDGRASEDELGRHEMELQAAFRAQYTLTSGGRAGTFGLVMPRGDHDERSEESRAGAPSVIVLSKVDFDGPPTDLRLELGVFGSDEGDDRFAVTATRGSDREVAHFTPARKAHSFFETTGQRLLGAARLGFEHIFEGFDHLLFVLTIAAGLKVRPLVAVLTAFTVAHSITLALAAQGIVSIPASVVEPLIAASIALVALMNLTHRVPSIGAHLAIVFACGLVHGLGFAAALGGLGLEGMPRVLALAGFNLGIEAGQLAFVGGCAVLAWLAGTLLARAGRPFPGDRLTTVTSAVAASAGLFWLVARLFA